MHLLCFQSSKLNFKYQECIRPLSTKHSFKKRRDIHVKNKSFRIIFQHGYAPGMIASSVPDKIVSNI